MKRRYPLVKAHEIDQKKWTFILQGTNGPLTVSGTIDHREEIPDNPGVYEVQGSLDPEDPERYESRRELYDFDGILRQDGKGYLLFYEDQCGPELVQHELHDEDKEMQRIFVSRYRHWPVKKDSQEVAMA